MSAVRKIQKKSVHPVPPVPSLSIVSFVKNIPINLAPSSADFVFLESAKNRVLGKKYELSLVFVGQKKARDLNLEHRKKDYATDILSFQIEKNIGEIIICPDIARKKSPLFERTYPNYLKFIFIHGLFHLKGYQHSSRMESEEHKIRKVFGV